MQLYSYDIKNKNFNLYKLGQLFLIYIYMYIFNRKAFMYTRLGGV